MKKRPLTFADPGRFEIYSHHSAPTLYPEETHETVQICVPMEGALYSVTRQSETGRTVVHSLGARDVLVIPAGQPHSVHWRRPAGIVCFQISQRFIAEATGLPQLHLGDAFALRDPFISAAAAQLNMSLDADDRPNLAFADAIATVIAYRVALGAAVNGGFRPQEKVPPFSHAQLLRLERFIDDHLDQPISLAMLAAQMNLSVWHFVRRFNASYGLPPHAFIIERRLIRAQTLLLKSDRSIIDVALEVGLSHSHFSRSFLRRFGVSPREFRRRQRV